MELDTDESSLAVGRIERALSRLENTLSLIVSRAPELPLGIAGAPTNASPSEEDQAFLRQEVIAVIEELDRLISEAEHG
jgi:hypothetical protein